LTSWRHTEIEMMRPVRHSFPPTPRRCGRSGAIAIGVAILTAPTLLAAAGAADAARAAHLRAELQSVADSAAQAAAAIDDGTPQGHANAAYLARAYVAASEPRLPAHARIAATIVPIGAAELSVVLTTTMPSHFFGALLPRFDIDAHATAPTSPIARTAALD
jgi:hypothetical protein